MQHQCCYNLRGSWKPDWTINFRATENCPRRLLDSFIREIIALGTPRPPEESRTTHPRDTCRLGFALAQPSFVMILRGGGGALGAQRWCTASIDLQWNEIVRGAKSLCPKNVTFGHIKKIRSKKILGTASKRKMDPLTPFRGPENLFYRNNLVFKENADFHLFQNSIFFPHAMLVWWEHPFRDIK